ncbi:MrpA C-terminal/MbhD domain-containing protein, partial [Dysosmobacter welbionis]
LCLRVQASAQLIHLDVRLLQQSLAALRVFRRHRSPEELPYLLHPVDRLVAVGRQGILHAAQICDGPDQLQQGGSALHRLQLRGG